MTSLTWPQRLRRFLPTLLIAWAPLALAGEHDHHSHDHHSHGHQSQDHSAHASHDHDDSGHDDSGQDQEAHDNAGHESHQHVGEHHGAHMHGVGHLNVAVDGARVMIYLQTPAADIVGFEYAPTNAEEQLALSTAHSTLNAAAELFHFVEADCSVTAGSGVEVPVSGQSGNHAAAYSDIVAEYTFVCADEPATAIDVHLFDAFPELQVLKTVWLREVNGDFSQGVLELNRHQSQIQF